ncbi:hypothetical protein HYX00_05810 [Candidatus Woesearchaeota archaeon]|nr:hypothetical protein [Candidatus Woesearchaeota archaeon]
MFSTKLSYYFRIEKFKNGSDFAFVVTMVSNIPYSVLLGSAENLGRQYGALLKKLQLERGELSERLGIVEGDVKGLEGVTVDTAHQLGFALLCGDHAAVTKVLQTYKFQLEGYEGKYPSKPTEKELTEITEKPKEDPTARVRNYIASHPEINYIFVPSQMSRELRISSHIPYRILKNMGGFRKIEHEGRVAYKRTGLQTQTPKEYEGSLSDAVRKYVRARSRVDEFNPDETSRYFRVRTGPVYKIYRSIPHLTEKKTSEGKTRFVRKKK